jgi:hypothetical protein
MRTSIVCAFGTLTQGLTLKAGRRQAPESRAQKAEQIGS